MDGKGGHDAAGRSAPDRRVGVGGVAADRVRATGTAAVRIEAREGCVELRFDRGFTAADVAAVKALAGRKWERERLTWVLPDTPATRQALERSFGDRLVRSDGAGQAPPEDVARIRTGHGDAPAADLPIGAARADGPTPGEGSPDASRADATSHSLGATDARAGDPMARDAVLERLREAIRLRDYSRRTERAYLGWADRFLRFHGEALDAERLDSTHVRAFLEHLATGERLAAKSRNQAAAALGFMSRELCGRDVVAAVPRAKGDARVPVVLSHREVLRVLRELVGKYFLIVVLLYSGGLRIEECLRLRVKDIDFELRQILIRDGKGKKDRYVPLARRAVDLLRAQIARVLGQHSKDRAAGHGWAALPGALHRKDPQAGYDPGWQFLFPASTLNRDPATGRTGRWPLHVTAVQREVKRAVRRSGVPKRASCHTFRHSFATEAIRAGCDISTLQHVMGHKDVRTTTIYLHVVEQSGFTLRSPLDRTDDEYEPDGIGRPWDGTAQEWALAASQWNRASPRERRRKDAAPESSSRKSE